MREEKVNSSGTVYYVRDGDNVLIETDANLITQAHYTDFPGMWGGLTSERSGGVSSFYGFDQQGGVRVLLSLDGSVTDAYLYKAFGEELAVSGSTVNSLRFGGQVGYWRDNNDRIYARARHYQPEMARWMSRDLIEQDSNLYKYTSNNPIGYLDATGKSACAAPCCGPNVEREVLDAASTLLNDYLAVNKNTRRHACFVALIPGYEFKFTRFINAWDYCPFVPYSDWMDKSWFTAEFDVGFNKGLQPCTSPQSTCEGTVQVGKGCYHYYSVNYLAFGMICFLCGQERWQMETDIDVWKTAYHWKDVREAKAWANFGYDLLNKRRIHYPKYPSTGNLSHDCPPKCKRQLMIDYDETPPFIIKWRGLNHVKCGKRRRLL